MGLQLCVRSFAWHARGSRPNSLVLPAKFKMEAGGGGGLNLHNFRRFPFSIFGSPLKSSIDLGLLQLAMMSDESLSSSRIGSIPARPPKLLVTHPCHLLGCSPGPMFWDGIWGSRYPSQ